MDTTKNRQSLHAASVLIKEQARLSLQGHMGIAVGATVIYVILSTLIAMLTLVGFPLPGLAGTVLGYVVMFLIDILLGVLEFGLVSIFMQLQYRQTPGLDDLFAGFHESSLQIIQIRVFTTAVICIAQLPLDLFIQHASARTDMELIVMIAITCTLCALYLLFVCWFALAYAMCWYILLDYPQMRWREVMRRSRHMMDGNKRVLLYLELSLIPWYLLAVLTLGIASFWINAYQSAIEAAFYRGLINSKKNKTSR